MKRTKTCSLIVSEDLRTLYWVYNDARYSSDLMKRYIRIEDIEGIIYGPHTYTFNAYKMQHLVDMHQDEKDHKTFIPLKAHSLRQLSKQKMSLKEGLDSILHRD